MRYSDEFRDRQLVEMIASRLLPCDAVIMEVCGTHTMSVARFGLKSLLPTGVKLISGPGCPVCVTDQRDIDSFLALGDVPGITLTTFGDMLRVPGSRSTLEQMRAAGADVRVVYSPLDAVELAKDNPAGEVVFFAVGFETTMPATALAIKSAAEQCLGNFSAFCVHKTMPAALRALLTGGDVRVSGLLLPGHVSTIIGVESFRFIAEELKIPCAVAGFEPADILLGIDSILRQIEQGTAIVDNAYPRAVRAEPNRRAAALIQDVYVPADAVWRGIGTIAGSGAAIGDRYAPFDAARRYARVLSDVPPAVEISCRCGEVLRGAIEPRDCPDFAIRCTPDDPIGPCMVSSEGACAAVYRYEGSGS